MAYKPQTAVQSPDVLEQVKRNVKTLAVGLAERQNFAVGVRRACELLQEGQTLDQVEKAAPENLVGNGMKAAVSWLRQTNPEQTQPQKRASKPTPPPESKDIDQADRPII